MRRGSQSAGVTNSTEGDRPIVLAGRKSHTVRASLIAAVALALSGLLIPGASADPEPSIDEVQRRVDELHQQAEQASERFNTIRAQLGDARQELRALEADADDQADETERLRRQVEQLVLAQVDGIGLGTTSQLLMSDDPDDFISSMAAMRSYSDQTADLLVSYEDARQELPLREQQAQDQLDDIAAAREQMAREKAEIEEKAGAAEALLSRLEAEAAARQASRPRPARTLRPLRPPSPPPSPPEPTESPPSRPRPRP